MAKRKRGQMSSSSGGGNADEEVEINVDNDNQPTSSTTTSLLNTHPHNLLPNYLSEAFSELYEQDGLMVMGRGLGWLSLLCSFVRYYGDTIELQEEDEDDNTLDMKQSPADEETQSRRKLPLVFVLNLRDYERQTLISTLSSWGTPTTELPTIITSEEVPASERSALYARGGVFVITSRILIVDLLQGTAKAKDIEGMLVAHAEKVVNEKSMDAFILRIFRSQRYFMDSTSIGSSNTNRGGFIKAFTDDPAALLSGFAKIDKTLKALQVQRLFLYPRFHASVSEELERQPPTVFELAQPLSQNMKSIQDNIAAAITSCVRDLRQKAPQLDLSFLSNDDDSGSKQQRKRKRDNEDFMTNYTRGTTKRKSSVDELKQIAKTCATNNFIYTMNRHLQTEGNNLSWDAKQIIDDLKQLSRLLHYLIEYDCVQFWKCLQAMKARSSSSRNPSVWMMQDAGESLFQLAKDRVYRTIKQSNKSGETIDKLKTVLEDKPKERLLHQVLTEIENRWNAKQQKAQKGSIPSSANVLVMVKDERALQSVHSYLSSGSGKRASSLSFLKHLDQVVQKSKTVLRPGGHDLDSLPTEQRLLYQEHSVVRKYLFGDTDERDDYHKVVEEDQKRLKHWKKRHRKMIEEKTRGDIAADSIRQQGQIDEIVEESRGGLDMLQKIDIGNEYSDNDDDAISTDSWSSSEDEDELAYKVEPIEGMRLFIRTFSKVSEGEAAMLLHDTRPQYVVMYDSDEAFIRTLEIYSNSIKPNNLVGDISPSPALAEEDRLQVFFLLYQHSAEEYNFTRSLEKEKDAFDRLIEHKKRMPTQLPTFNNFTTQEMQQACGGAGGSYAGGSLPLSMDTRTGGGKQRLASKERRDIAVDVREFRAALPSVLHQGGMRLAPATLTVGDFVLSNVHCVERKSISDLFGSFNSGRLQDQARAMCKYYKCPILLIEFDPEKTFGLQSASDIGGEVRKDSIISKLSMLTMEFPTLRILWSKSPHETLKIFKKLKRNHQEVDVEKAIEIGSNDQLDDLLGKEGDEDDDNESNDAAKQMLRKLPGVNANNARNIMNECDSIAELSRLSREELKRIAGPVAGQKLFSFFGRRFET